MKRDDVPVIQKSVLKTPKRIFKCPLGCDKSYTTQSHLKRHLALIHSDNEPKIVSNIIKEKTTVEKINCIFCKLTFSWREAFLNHIKHAHNQRKYFKCEFCEPNELFGEKEFFVQHLKAVHDADHACRHAECDKAFFHSNGLQNHLRKEHNEESVISL